MNNIACALDIEFDKENLLEIGITTIRIPTLEILKTYSIPIKPFYEREIDPEIIKLTGWTRRKLEKQGVSLPEACRRLDNYGFKNRLIITDSETEVSTLEKMLGHFTNEQNPLDLVYRVYDAGLYDSMNFFQPEYSNLQVNISLMFKLLTKNLESVSLEDMLSYYNLTFEGIPHRANWDSLNIAKIFVEMMK